MLDELRRRFEEEIEKVGITHISTALAVSRGTIYNWIGKGNAPLDKLMALKANGVDVVYILTGQRTMDALSRDELELLERYRAASPEGKAAAIGALRGVASAAPKFSVGGSMNAQVFEGGATNTAPVTFNISKDKERKK
ncbi:MAG: helix-turn-helix domain-containing protein [Pseudomonadota bacterium]